MGLEARGRGGAEKKEKKEKKEEKIPHMCESIGYQILQGHYPKGDQPTDQPTKQLSDQPTDQLKDRQSEV